ncbi:unnamed protein product [Pedinophyceae sp. YPF-701]|nr:unnamed protein product [Pedinophyceae sp. YPF-701]
MWVLTFTGGRGHPKEHQRTHFLTSGTYIVGRDASAAQIHISKEEDPSISRKHGSFTIGSSTSAAGQLTCTYTDFGSKYGTRIGGRELRKGSSAELTATITGDCDVVFGSDAVQAKAAVSLQRRNVTLCVRKPALTDAVRHAASLLGARTLSRWSATCTHLVVDDDCPASWRKTAPGRSPVLLRWLLKSVVEDKNYGLLFPPPPLAEQARALDGGGEGTQSDTDADATDDDVEMEEVAVVAPTQQHKTKEPVEAAPRAAPPPKAAAAPAPKAAAAPAPKAAAAPSAAPRNPQKRSRLMALLESDDEDEGDDEEKRLPEQRRAAAAAAARSGASQQQDVAGAAAAPLVAEQPAGAATEPRAPASQHRATAPAAHARDVARPTQVTQAVGRPEDDGTPEECRATVSVCRTQVAGSAAPQPSRPGRQRGTNYKAFRRRGEEGATGSSAPRIVASYTTWNGVITDAAPPADERAEDDELFNATTRPTRVVGRGRGRGRGKR